MDFGTEFQLPSMEKNSHWIISMNQSGLLLDSALYLEDDVVLGILTLPEFQMRSNMTDTYFTYIYAGLL